MLHKATIPFLSLSAVGIFGNAFIAYSAYYGKSRIDYRMYLLAAILHVVDVVYSVSRLAPLNEKLLALRSEGGQKIVAVQAARDWAEANARRLYLLAAAGILAGSRGLV